MVRIFANEKESSYIKENLRENGINTFVKGKAVRFDDHYLHVELEDGRIISTPMSWYKELQYASLFQLKNYTLIFQETDIEWPDLDYHLSIESMWFSQRQKQTA